MLALLRRDPVLRALPTWLLVAPLFASGIEDILTPLAAKATRAAASPAGGEFGDLLPLAVAVWLPVSVFLLISKTRQRCSSFDMALPLPTRNVWATHLIAVAFSALVLSVAAGVGIMIVDRLTAQLSGDTPVPQAGMVTIAAPLFVNLLLAVALLQSSKPELFRIPFGKGFGLAAVAGLAALVGLTVGLAGLPLFWSLPPLGIAVALALRSYRGLPRAYSLVPLEPESVTLTHGAATDRTDWIAMPKRGGHRFRWALLLQVYRMLTSGEQEGPWVAFAGKPIATLLAFPVLFVWGALLAGYFGEEKMSPFYIVFTVFFLLTLLPGSMSGLHRVDSLPVSRRTLFTLLSLPPLVALVAGYSAGSFGVAVKAEANPPIRYQRAAASRYFPPWPTEKNTLRVSTEYCEIAWDGNLPSLESPWGEAHEPPAVPLHAGGRALLYSPFGTPEDASPEFVAWQLSRAIEAVYGESVPPEEVLDRYLEPDPGGGVRLIDGGRPLQASLASVDIPEAVRVLPVVSTSIALVYLLCFAIYLQAFRATRSDKFRVGVFRALLAVLILLLAAQLIEPWAPIDFLKLLIRHAAAHLPGGELAIWAVCFALFLGTYRLAQSRFLLIEVPLPRVKSPAE